MLLLLLGVDLKKKACWTPAGAAPRKIEVGRAGGRGITSTQFLLPFRHLCYTKLCSPLEMESSVVTTSMSLSAERLSAGQAVTMYGFRLNPRETSYVVERVLSTTNCVSPLMVRAYLGGMLEEEDMYEEIYVQLVSQERFPDGLSEIPSSYPYMLVFGLTIGQGTTYEQLRTLHREHPMFQDIRPLRRWFREVFDLRLQFTSDQAGIYSGHGLPDKALAVQRAGASQIT